MAEWDPKQYLKFKKQRTQPAIDLAARIPLEEPEKILDVGCGPGNSTAVLQKRFPKAKILGLDSSEEMVRTAKERYPELDFISGDAAALDSLNMAFDVIFSNACLQWVPNHTEVLKGMLNCLRKDGVLAVQIPVNQNMPMHQIIRQTSREERWKDKFPQPRIFYQLTPEEYFDFFSKNASDFSMWETTYFYRLSGYADFMEWYKGTGLRPYLQCLSDEEQIAFMAEILHAVKERYSLQANGEIIFRFPRFFFVVQK